MKFEDAKAETFIDLYVTGLYSLKEMCRMAGFSMSTYYHWKASNEGFKKKLAEAEKLRIPEIKEASTRALMRLIEGGEYEEIHEEYERPDITIMPKYPYLDSDDPLNVEAAEKEIAKMQEMPPVLVRRKISHKVIMPNAQSVQFALRNLDKENFPDLQKQEITGEGGKPIPILLIKPESIDTHFPSDLDAPTDDDSPI